MHQVYTFDDPGGIPLGWRDHSYTLLEPRAPGYLVSALFSAPHQA